MLCLIYRTYSVIYSKTYKYNWHGNLHVIYKREYWYSQLVSSMCSLLHTEHVRQYTIANQKNLNTSFCHWPPSRWISSLLQKSVLLISGRVAKWYMDHVQMQIMSLNWTLLQLLRIIAHNVLLEYGERRGREDESGKCDTKKRCNGKRRRWQVPRYMSPPHQLFLCAPRFVRWTNSVWNVILKKTT